MRPAAILALLGFLVLPGCASKPNCGPAASNEFTSAAPFEDARVVNESGATLIKWFLTTEGVCTDGHSKAYAELTRAQTPDPGCRSLEVVRGEIGTAQGYLPYKLVPLTVQQTAAGVRMPFENTNIGLYDMFGKAPGRYSITFEAMYNPTASPDADAACLKSLVKAVAIRADYYRAP